MASIDADSPQPNLPCPRPDAAVVPGRLVDLELIDPARHAPDLWRAIGMKSDRYALEGEW